MSSTSIWFFSLLSSVFREELSMLPPPWSIRKLPSIQRTGMVIPFSKYKSCADHVHRTAVFSFLEGHTGLAVVGTCGRFIASACGHYTPYYFIFPLAWLSIPLTLLLPGHSSLPHRVNRLNSDDQVAHPASTDEGELPLAQEQSYTASIRGYDDIGLPTQRVQSAVSLQHSSRESPRVYRHLQEASSSAILVCCNAGSHAWETSIAYPTTVRLGAIRRYFGTGIFRTLSLYEHPPSKYDWCILLGWLLVLHQGCCGAGPLLSPPPLCAKSDEDDCRPYEY